jgi:hypothetical protein
MAEMKWISIEDESPEDGVEVLVHQTDGTKSILAHYGGSGGAYPWQSSVGNWIRRDMVKYWMPLDALPEPPEV